jgi:hypothetical protein
MPQTSVERETREDTATKTDAATQGGTGLCPSPRPRVSAAPQLRASGSERYCGGMVMSESSWLSAAHNSPAWIHPWHLLDLRRRTER